jgi:hypothetical protein
MLTNLAVGVIAAAALVVLSVTGILGQPPKPRPAAKQAATHPGPRPRLRPRATR